MKKYLILFVAAMFLVACGNSIELNKTNFIETYERINDRNFPENILYSDEAGVINLDDASKDEVLDLLYTVEKFTTSKELKRMIKSIEKEESNIKGDVETDTHHISYYENLGDGHTLLIRNKEVE